MSENIKDCPDCGWWCKKTWRFSNNKCEPKRGTIARAIATEASTLPNVTVTHQGYGYGNFGVTFGPDHEGAQRFTIRMRVLSDGEVSIEDVIWLRDDKPDVINKLVKLLAQFQKDNP